MLFLLFDSVSGSPMKIEFYLSDKNKYILKASDTIFLIIYSMISDTLLPFTGTQKWCLDWHGPFLPHLFNLTYTFNLQSAFCYSVPLFKNLQYHFPFDLSMISKMVFWLFFLPHIPLIPICDLYCSLICSFLFPIFLCILVMIPVISYCLDSFHVTVACYSLLFLGLVSIIGNMEISWKQKLFLVP